MLGYSMKLELLISAVNAEPEKLIKKMHVFSDAVLVNQNGTDSEEELPLNGCTVRVFNCDEKGVGKSRNHCIDKAAGDILLFSDDDVEYDAGYGDLIISEFEEHPEADALFFNLNVDESRRTYWNNDFGRVRIWNFGRYPAYSMAVRKDALVKSGVRYSLLFGGGAKYSCGEDSLFIRDCLRAGLKLYRTPVVIGSEALREGGESTWFKGYNEKFFFDRGVLFYFLYGKLAGVFGFRFVYSKRNVMCREIPWKQAFKILKSGIKEGKQTDAGKRH